MSVTNVLVEPPESSFKGELLCIGTFCNIFVVICDDFMSSFSSKLLPAVTVLLAGLRFNNWLCRALLCDRAGKGPLILIMFCVPPPDVD